MVLTFKTRRNNMAKKIGAIASLSIIGILIIVTIPSAPKKDPSL